MLFNSLSRLDAMAMGGGWIAYFTLGSKVGLHRARHDWVYWSCRCIIEINAIVHVRSSPEF
jgi:hypothetical protein